jgi:hypothetical protein
MTDTTTTATKPSRLRTALERAERAETATNEPRADHVDDFTTADERLSTFWRKYKDGTISSQSTRRELPDGGAEWTVTVRVEVQEPEREVTASATRSTVDGDPIVAAYPHETAQTAALSRALRFLGIKLQTRSKS